MTAGRGSRFLSSPKRLDHITAHLASHAMSTVFSFLQRQSELGVKLTIDTPILPRMLGAIPLLLLFAFIMCKGTTSSLRKKALKIDFHIAFKHDDLLFRKRSIYHCINHFLWSIKKKTDQHEHSPSAE